MKVLEINERFAQYFDTLDYGQEQQLERSMLADLTTEPILWWHNPEKDRDEILDGHNRYKIACKHKLDIQYHEKHFDNETDAEHFIIRTQTQRRNIAPGDRDRLLKRAVAIEISRGKKKTEAVENVAEEMGVAQSTAWEAVKEKTPVQQFFEDKKVYERDLERVRNKEVEKLKQRAVKGGYADDEERLTAEWEPIEAEIQAQFAKATSQLEQTAESIQTAQEAEGGRPQNIGGKRTTKKSTKDRAARRNTFKKALSLIGKLKNEAFYFWTQNGCGDVDITESQRVLTALAVQISNAQDVDAKAAQKRKFGGR